MADVKAQSDLFNGIIYLDFLNNFLSYCVRYIFNMSFCNLVFTKEKSLF